MIQYDPKLDVFHVNGVPMTADLVQQALAQPWWWAAQRQSLPPAQRAAIEAAMRHVEQHGFPEAT